MEKRPLNVVTGAFSYTGSYIARALLAKGVRVKTLTGHPERPSPFGGDNVEAVPYQFGDYRRLVDSLKGAEVFYNTYWVRFNYGRVTFDGAVERSRMLISAARDAGVSRFVQISITNPSPNAKTPYFRGKAEVEKAIKESGLSYAIIRPTIVFGREDILLNNIAWLLRRSPVFFVFGDGEYEVQPVFVEDLASLAVEVAERRGDVVCDAAGPEIYRFIDLVGLIKKCVGSRAMIVRTPPEAALLAAGLFNRLVNDIMVTRDEVTELMGALLVSKEPPTCKTRLSEWLKESSGWLGKAYASELERHYR